MRIAGSTFTGDLPLQRFSAIDGAFMGYSPLGAFKTLYNQPAAGEKMLALFAEYNFTSIPFEMLGLDYCAQNKYEFSLHGAIGRTWLRESALQRLSGYYNPVYYTDYRKELGFSVNLKFKFMGVKLYATRCLDTGNDYLGFTFNLISFSLE